MKKITTEIQIGAPPSVVWGVLVDFSEMEWNPFFASIKGQLAVGERLAIVLRKPRVTIRPRITALEHGRRSSGAAVSGFGGSWAVAISSS
jgi:hypothetical protein